MQASGPGKAQGFEKDRVSELQGLLATDEHPTVAAIPTVAGATKASQPGTVPAPLDAEDAQEAAGTRNRIHCHQEPFVHRLVLVLQAQLRANFGRTELEAELLSRFVCLGDGTAVRETEFGVREDDQIDLSRLGGNVSLFENVAAPVTDAVASLFELFTQVLVGLVGTELDGHPRGSLHNRTTSFVFLGQFVEELVVSFVELGMAHSAVQIPRVPALHADALTASGIVVGAVGHLRVVNEGNVICVCSHGLRLLRLSSPARVSSRVR